MFVLCVLMGTVVTVRQYAGGRQSVCLSVCLFVRIFMSVFVDTGLHVILFFPSQWMEHNLMISVNYSFVRIYQISNIEFVDNEFSGPNWN